MGSERETRVIKSRLVTGLLLLFVAACTGLEGANAQDGEWVWAGGSSTPYQAGVYGTLGSPSASNVPGSRSESATWVDHDGNLWLFGGFGVPASKPWSALNDLWMFNASTGQWTWMGGGTTGLLPGVYGTLGTAAAGNIPGARFGAMSEADRNGNFWLFGGFGVDSGGTAGLLNDLWVFNPFTNQWTWAGGSNTSGQSGSYGTQGISAVGNIPGARELVAGWIDSNGQFWLFGGVHFDAQNNSLYLNDLWKFDPASDRWAWVGGPQAPATNAAASGVYGTLGVASASNVPGGRSLPATWADGAGHIWLFGGEGVDSGGNTGSLSDLWRYDINSGAWTWMGGSNTVSAQAGVYGTLGVPASGNYPGSRRGALSWIDKYGRFWLFGGYGHDVNGTAGNLGDLWMFNPPLNEWTWVGGSNSVESTSVYGTLGVAASGNVPGARSVSATWTDPYGVLWLFAGYLSLPNNQFNLFTDLWKYQPSAPPQTAVPAFSLAGALTPRRKT